MTPTVAHIVDFYLHLSETFIYNYLTHLSAYRPVLLTRFLQNLELFPLDTVYPASRGRDSGTTWRLQYEVWRNLTMRIGMVPSFYDLGRGYFQTICEREKVHLIHAHYGQEGFRSLPLRRKLGVPLVTTFYSGHCITVLPRWSPLWRANVRRLYEEGDAFLVEGNFMKRGLVKLGCPPEKIHLIHICADLPKLHFTEHRLVPGEKVRIFFAGRFVPTKGLLYALEAFADVVQDFPNIEFRILGGGQLEGKVKKLIARHNLESFVTLLGYQPYTVYLHELHNAHLFIHPSVTTPIGSTEGGAPTALIEAQAVGLPVLSTCHADIPEVVLDGQSGYLVPERDVAALAEKLYYLVTHPSEWAGMGRVGRDHVEQNYNIDIEVHKLEAVYDSLLN